jgi:hypothetical protein
MEDKVMLSIIEKEQGLEVRVSEACYSNLAIIGLIEKIKLNLLEDLPEDTTETIYSQKKSNTQYDA